MTIVTPDEEGKAMTSSVTDASNAPQSMGDMILDDLSLGELEDRSAPRIALSLPAKLRASNASAFSVTVKDLSLSGFACHALSSMPQGTRCWLKMPGLETMQAKVVWNDGFMIGCSFHNLISQVVLDSLIARYSEPTVFNV